MTRLPDGGQLRLFFAFPNGGDRKILLNERRDGLTKGDLRAVGRTAAENNLLMNSRGEVTQGVARAALIKTFLINDLNAGTLIEFGGQ